MADVGIALGSNLGDSRALILNAIQLLAKHKAVDLKSVSRIYRTPAWGLTDQPDFLNACLTIDTNLEAPSLLNLCQQIEQRLGRKRDVKWGPRTIDIDILWYDGLVLETERLTIPHPQMLKRGFVLVPLSEIVPNRTFAGQTVKERSARYVAEGIQPAGEPLTPDELAELQRTNTATIQFGQAELKGTIISE
ncbi:MAG: 2-amino-4-hydroxy-6-hydroxymethyldihydropteridine diphosphokinase [Pseudomonadota bacterium]